MNLELTKNELTQLKLALLQRETHIKKKNLGENMRRDAESALFKIVRACASEEAA
jgi:hypothetical protein